MAWETFVEKKNVQHKTKTEMYKEKSVAQYK